MRKRIRYQFKILMIRNSISTLFSNFFASKYSYYYLYLFIFTFTCFLLFVFNIEVIVYILFFLLGLGWSLFFFKNELTLVEHFMISPVISFSLFISFMAICSLLSIKLTLILGIFFVIFSLLIFFLYNTFVIKNFRLKLEKSDLLVGFMVLVAISAKIIPVIDMNVPNLSDSMTHAFYSKIIMETGKIDFFYSPGIHIFSAFSTLFGGESVVKQILYLTNFFSAYSGIVLYFYIKKIFKNNVAALSGALLFSLGTGLSLFFYSGGKNALVVGISVLIFFLLVISLNRIKFSRIKTILSSIVLFATFIVHYPIAIFASIYWASIFLIDIKRDKVRNSFIFLGIFFGLLYMGVNYYAALGEFVTSRTPPPSITMPTNFFASVLSYITSLIKITKSHSFSNFNYWIVGILGLGILSILYELIKSKLRTYFWILILWFFGCFMLNLIISSFSLT